MNIASTLYEDDDLTNCSKCRQLLVDPTTLPCLHSLCAACFKQVCDAHSDSSTGVTTCPRCGDLPATPLQSLPDRGFVDTLVALRKISCHNLADDNCDICKQLSTNSERVAAAEYYCIECRQRMCATCCGPHRVFSVSKSHDVVGLGMASAKRVLDTLKSYFPACANHRDRYAVVHCYQCSIGLCSQCQNMHSSHEHEVLTDQTYDQLTNRVKSLSDRIRQVLDSCKEETQRVQKRLLDRRNGISLAEKEITDKADELISLIQKQRDELLNRLHSRHDQAITSLETASTKLLAALSANKRTARFAEELLEKGSVADMLLNYRMLNSRVSGVLALSAGVFVPNDSDCNEVLPSSIIQDVCTSLDSQSKSLFCYLIVSLREYCCLGLRLMARLRFCKLRSRVA